MKNEYFRHVGLIGRIGSAQVIDTLRQLKRYLQSRNIHVILEEETAAALPGHGLQVGSPNMLGEICDLVIVVGGDGSLLGAARSLVKYDVPILGVNRGNLGFLTDVAPDEIESKVGEVLAGHYTLEKRFLLYCEVKHGGESIALGDALNEVILYRGKTPRMIEFELYIEGHFVYSQRSDGLIAATPTGSTAYALSGGGPIVHPKLDAVVLVPMFPHTLSSRPIVIDANSEIKIVVSELSEIYPQVSCDGQNHMTVAPGDTIYIRKKSHKLNLIHPLKYNFYETCQSKLGWGTKL